MAFAARNAKPGLTAAVLLAGFTVSGCAPKPVVDDGEPAKNTITVAASDDFCQLSKTTALTGVSTFVVTNNGTRPTEFYVYGAGDRVMGSVGIISPGLQRRLAVHIPDPGRYYTSCKPGLIGDGIRADFVVTGNPVRADASDMFRAAAESYKSYLTTQSAGLVTATEAFVGTIKKGDVEGAQPLYAVARTYYERIAPIAEHLPNELARRIDLGEADLSPGETWTGFHRLEKDLWATRPRPDTNVVADQLVADVSELDATIRDPRWATDATLFTGGAQRLLGGMANSAITGDRDVFSHTDLWDLQANLDGSRVAVGSVRPIIAQREPDLGRQIDQAFATAQGLLDKHHWNDGFVYYDSVAEPERRELSRAFEALSTVVTQVQSVIAQP